MEPSPLKKSESVVHPLETQYGYICSDENGCIKLNAQDTMSSESCNLKCNTPEFYQLPLPEEVLDEGVKQLPLPEEVLDKDEEHTTIWCLEPECVESYEPFIDEEALDAHMGQVHGCYEFLP
jgi:hypothetical protein